MKGNELAPPVENDVEGGLLAGFDGENPPSRSKESGAPPEIIVEGCVTIAVSGLADTSSMISTIWLGPGAAFVTGFIPFATKSHGAGLSLETNSRRSYFARMKFSTAVTPSA
jgi:hypothetical protein